MFKQPKQKTHTQERIICNAKITERIKVYFVEIESNHGKQKDADRKCEKIQSENKSKRPLIADIQ